MNNTPVDKHGQPLNRRFNQKRNELKAAFGLKGILQGVVADQRLKESEILFLTVWMKSQEYLREDDGDRHDLFCAIERILDDGEATRDELDDMHQFINDINADKINELYGLMAGLISDTQLNEDEIYKLKDWLNINSNITREWPASIISKRIQHILEDGVIDEEEIEDLTETLKQISGVRFNESGLAYGISTEFAAEDIEELGHKNVNMCFTGEFLKKRTRDDVSKIAKNLGANIKQGVTLDLDYLVIGSIASRDWKFSSHGLKIKKALEYKQRGCKLKIISEETWLDFIS